MIEIVGEINAIHRRVDDAKTPGARTPGAKTPGAKVPGAKTPDAKTPGANTPGAKTPGAKTPNGDGHHVALSRVYAAAIDDVWDAITNPKRLSRWMMPVTGDFRLGGQYQLQGNAGGEILNCERPHVLRVSWVFGEAEDDNVPEVELRLSSEVDGQTTLVLEHTGLIDPAKWSQFGPGAVGVGWDLTLLGLGLHLRGEGIDPEQAPAWLESGEAREFMTRSSTAWGAALKATGAGDDAVASAVAATTAFYAPAPDVE